MFHGFQLIPQLQWQKSGSAASGTLLARKRARKVAKRLWLWWLLTANPCIQPPRKGPSELYNVVRDLKWKQPLLTAKQVHEQVCASALLPEPASLAAVKRCLELLMQRKRCPLVYLLPDDLFIDEIANELPLAALLNLSTTCSKAREVLTPTRLERSKEAVEATDRRRIRMSGGIYW